MADDAPAPFRGEPGWPSVTRDLPATPDPNYCIEFEAAA